jgi:transcriptional accessory protein Tex/SPT6
MLLDRKKIIKEMIAESNRIRDELHNDVTALIHAQDIRDLVQKVSDQAYSDGEVLVALCEAGMDHHIYAI